MLLSFTGCPFLKECCIASTTEACMAFDAGASAIGLVGPMPSGPGTIALDQASRISRDTEGLGHRFLLSSATASDALITEVDQTGVDVLQIVDHVPASVRLAVRSARPDLIIVQVVHVEDDISIEWALAAAETADALLLDSGSLTGPVKELGGTGRIHDWRFSADIVRRSPVPCLLAGGLGPDNVTAALQQVRPAGIDLCSRIRTNGVLDSRKLTARAQAMNLGSTSA